MTSYRINNLLDPSSSADAATKSYVDTATSGIATTSSVTTAITNALNNGSMVNNPSVTRKDTHNGYVFLAGVGVPGFVSPPVSGEGTGRCNLYMANNLFYVPNSDTLYAGTFSGAISGTTGTFSDAISIKSSVGSQKTIITSKGYIGIGSAANAPPSYPLQVDINTTPGAISAPYIKMNGTMPSRYLTLESESKPVWLVSILAQGSIMLTGDIIFLSDKRIKKNVKDIDGSTALSQIRQIRPKIYNYIDYNKKGNGNVYGFIAQDVKEVILHSTMCTKDYIPNFYCQGNIRSIDTTNYIYEISSENDLSFEKVLDDSGNEVLFHKVKIYGYDNTQYICSVLQVNNPKNIRVKLENEYKFANDEEDKYKVFIYGQQIYDLHNLEKNAIFTVATAALQEVDRQQQADKIRIAELEARVIHFESKMVEQQSLINDILERLKTLEKA